jgi:hypothetical protein
MTEACLTNLQVQLGDELAVVEGGHVVQVYRLSECQVLPSRHGRIVLLGLLYLKE